MRKSLKILLIMLIAVLFSSCQKEILIENSNFESFDLKEILSDYRNWLVPKLIILIDDNAMVTYLDTSIIEDTKNNERVVSYRPVMKKIIVGESTYTVKYINEDTLSVEMTSKIVDILKPFLMEKFNNKNYEMTILGNQSFYKMHVPDNNYILQSNKLVKEYSESEFYGYVVRLISGESVYSILIAKDTIQFFGN